MERFGSRLDHTNDSIPAKGQAGVGTRAPVLDQPVRSSYLYYDVAGITCSLAASIYGHIQ